MGPKKLTRDCVKRRLGAGMGPLAGGETAPCRVEPLFSIISRGLGKDRVWGKTKVKTRTSGTEGVRRQVRARTTKRLS